MDRGTVIGLLGGLIIAQICRENSEDYQNLTYSSRLLIGFGAGFMGALAGKSIGSIYHYFRYIHNGN
jgi:hypothetical protein